MSEDPELGRLVEALRQTRRSLEENRPPGVDRYARLVDPNDLPLGQSDGESRSRLWWRRAMFDVTQSSPESSPAGKPLRDELEQEQLATGEVRSLGRLSQAQRKAVHRLAKLRPEPVLTGTAALAAVGTDFRGHKEVELIWRGRERLGGLVERASRLLVDRPHQCVDQGGSEREHRLRLTGPCDLNVEISLVADPRPPVVLPVRVQFGGLAVATDPLRAVCSSILDRLASRPDLEDLFRLELCLKARADLGVSLKDLRALSPATNALDLVWSLRALDQLLADPADSACATLGLGWRQALSVFVWRLQRRLIDLS